MRYSHLEFLRISIHLRSVYIEVKSNESNNQMLMAVKCRFSDGIEETFQDISKDKVVKKIKSYLETELKREERSYRFDCNGCMFEVHTTNYIVEAMTQAGNIGFKWLMNKDLRNIRKLIREHGIKVEEIEHMDLPTIKTANLSQNLLAIDATVQLSNIPVDLLS